MFSSAVAPAAMTPYCLPFAPTQVMGVVWPPAGTRVRHTLAEVARQTHTDSCRRYQSAVLLGVCYAQTSYYEDAQRSCRTREIRGSVSPSPKILAIMVGFANSFNPVTQRRCLPAISTCAPAHPTRLGRTKRDTLIYHNMI